MPDSDIRTLERRYLETGDIADRDAYEQALHRTGVPTRQQLYQRMAAALKWKAATAQPPQWILDGLAAVASVSDFYTEDDLKGMMQAHVKRLFD